MDAGVAVRPSIVEAELERVMRETMLMFVGRRPQDRPDAEKLDVLRGLTVRITKGVGLRLFQALAFHPVRLSTTQCLARYMSPRPTV